MCNTRSLEILTFLLFVGFSLSLLAKDPQRLPEIIGTETAIIKKYNLLQKKMSALSCAPGTEETFKRLLINYRGNGFFLPLTHSEQLDNDTISKYLPQIDGKIKWIKAQKQNLDLHKNLLNIKKSVTDLRLLLNILLDQNKIFYSSHNLEEKRNADKKSIIFYDFLKIKYGELIAKTPFFLPYNFPTDYLELRKNFDQIKDKKDSKSVRKANEIFFLRKILEDGTAQLDHSNNDLFFRTTLSTLYLSFKGKDRHLTEAQRIDLDYILKTMEYNLSLGKKHLLARLDEWEQRSHRIYNFYQSILSGRYIENGKVIKADEMVKIKSSDRFKLSEFVTSKFTQVYQFWASQEGLMKYFYVIDTILYNEIGEIDAPDNLERKDITQIIINRFFEKKYNRLSTLDSLWKNLFGNFDKKTDENLWLNLLFKEGEFSFTYYYMDASLRVFCPSMTKQSKKIRNENLLIALYALKNPDDQFKALRYFSRISMLGRIDMTTLWQDYKPIPERPGKLIKNDKYIKNKYQKNLYNLLYRFLDETKNSYDVLEIENKNYVKEVGTLRFYKYRSPHLFKYFKKK